jgi:hypothetical protein
MREIISKSINGAGGTVKNSQYEAFRGLLPRQNAPGTRATEKINAGVDGR